MSKTFGQIREYHNRAIQSIDSRQVAVICDAMVVSLNFGYPHRPSTLFVCGNGGSAADAQHFVAELVVKFGRIKREAIRAMALTADTSVLTAVGNDFGYRMIFKRQIEALGRAGDILLCLSTSGYSENVLLAVKEAKNQGMAIWSITGCDTNPLAIESDIVVTIKGDAARIQEGTMLILHYLALAVDDIMQKEEYVN